MPDTLHTPNRIPKMHKKENQTYVKRNVISSVMAAVELASIMLPLHK